LTLAFLIAVIGALLTPYRVGATLVPISLVIAVAGIIGTIWFALRVTGHRVVAMLPGVVWLAVSLFASSRTTEGDLILISSNWVASGYLLAGPIAIAACGYWLFYAQRRRS